MDEYKGLLKEKGKALNVFEKTRDKLQHVVARINEARHDNQRVMDDCKNTITERNEANMFLVEEETKTMNTINKINGILEG